MSSCSVHPLTVSSWFRGPLSLWHACHSVEQNQKASSGRHVLLGSYFVIIFLTKYSARWQQSLVRSRPSLGQPPCGHTLCRLGHILGPRRHRATRTRYRSRSCSRSRCPRAPPRYTTHGRSRALTHGRQPRRRQRRRHRSLAQGWDPTLGRELGRSLYRPPTLHQEREPNRGRT